jgi:hypothetical protein
VYRQIYTKNDLNNSATIGTHCHLNIDGRTGRVAFNDVFKGLGATYESTYCGWEVDGTGP